MGVSVHSHTVKMETQEEERGRKQCQKTVKREKKKDQRETKEVGLASESQK